MLIGKDPILLVPHPFGLEITTHEGTVNKSMDAVQLLILSRRCADAACERLLRDRHDEAAVTLPNPGIIIEPWPED